MLRLQTGTQMDLMHRKWLAPVSSTRSHPRYESGFIVLCHQASECLQPPREVGPLRGSHWRRRVLLGFLF
ncbi:hypothetical protein CgunFtcFv8_008103 [Champsocephalus gunnari]|uniref:Uncharacterized protein n=1 Tax=Champsocephalus gunnari TaxID=52237 RepID=A0AAN8HFL2_CHAGU|nr:hypothetical protein CgunFtcFv8_008103 [Champsocephalus gunnari]